MENENTDSSSNENQTLAGVTSERAVEATDLVSGLAGRELDAAVAERVMGITRRRTNLCGMPVPIRGYSSNIAAAMQVKRKMNESGWWLDLTDIGQNPLRIKARFSRATDAAWATGDNESEAISRAAYAAVEATNQHAEGGTTLEG